MSYYTCWICGPAQWLEEQCRRYIDDDCAVE